MIEGNDICSLRSEVVYCNSQIKSLGPVDESVPTAISLQGFLFYGLALKRTVLFSKIVALPEEGRSPVKCDRRALDLLTRSQPRYTILYTSELNDILVRLSLFLQGVRGRLAFLDRCLPSISWNLMITYE